MWAMLDFAAGTPCNPGIKSLDMVVVPIVVNFFLV